MIPLITIGITSYNSENTIARAIESALNQSWSNAEIIINDDASNDKTVSVLEDYEKKYDNIELILNFNNTGVASSRNKILNKAKGKYVAFFDDDDVSNVNRLKIQYQRIKDYKNRWSINDPIICHTSRLIIFTDGKTAIEETIGCNLDKIAPNGNEVASRILLGTPLNDGIGSIATCSQMGLKEDYLSIGGFDESFRRQEDTEFNIRLALSNCHFIGIKEPLVCQYLTQSVDKNIKIEEESTLNCLKKHQDYINNNSKYSFVVSWIKVKFMLYKKDYFLFVFHFILLLFNHPVYTIRRLISALPNLKKNYKYFSDNRR